MWYITIKIYNLADLLNLQLANNYSNCEYLFQINNFNKFNYKLYLNVYVNNNFYTFDFFKFNFGEFYYFLLFQIIINLLILYSFFYNF